SIASGPGEGRHILSLNHVVWTHPLVCESKHPVTVHITLSPQESGTISFLIGSIEEEELTELVYCQGIVELQALFLPPNVDLVAIQTRCQQRFSASDCYQRYHELGLDYGPAFQGIEELRVGAGEVLARFRLPAALGEGTSLEEAYPLPYILHPSVLDAAL